MHNKIITTIIFLVFATLALASHAALDTANTATQDMPSQCTNFDQIALQFALAQNNMQSPLSIEKINMILGKGNLEKNSVTTTYSWVYKNLTMLVIVTDDNIATKILSGIGDDSPTAKKMEQIYEKLKTATSVWFIKEIEQQLGPAQTKSVKKQYYSWICKDGKITLGTNQNNDIAAATIRYDAAEDVLKARLSFDHPPWNIKMTNQNKSFCSWERTFEN